MKRESVAEPFSNFFSYIFHLPTAFHRSLSGICACRSNIAFEIDPSGFISSRVRRQEPSEIRRQEAVSGGFTVVKSTIDRRRVEDGWGAAAAAQPTPPLSPFSSVGGGSVFASTNNSTTANSTGSVACTPAPSPLQPHQLKVERFSSSSDLYGQHPTTFMAQPRVSFFLPFFYNFLQLFFYFQSVVSHNSVLGLLRKSVSSD